MLLTRVTNLIERHSAASACRLRVLFGNESGTEIALPPVGVVVGAETAACRTAWSESICTGSSNAQASSLHARKTATIRPRGVRVLR